MAKTIAVLITVLVACAALVQTAPAWKQQEDNEGEGFIQYLADLIQKADTELREQDLPMFNTKLREQDLPMFETKLREQDLPMFETKLREQDLPMFETEVSKQEVEVESPTPVATAEELNTQILEKMSELRKLLEKKTQLLAREQYLQGLNGNERNLIQKLIQEFAEQQAPRPPSG